MGSNIRQFELGLRKWTGKVVPERIGQYQRAVVLEAARGVILMSPVDSGFFRSRWRVYSDEESIPFQVVSSAVYEAFKAKGAKVEMGEVLMAVAAALPDIQPYTLTGIVNDAPYADELEKGHSQQAPRGMVAVTANRLKAKGLAR